MLLQINNKVVSVVEKRILTTIITIAKMLLVERKRHNRSQKPLEVDDEAVARQVKETLARLTSKSQNKKGAKYRKEKREAVQERLSAEAKAERKEK